MGMADTLTLIAESPNAHGVFDAPKLTQRTVFCTVRSASRRGRYEAMSSGHAPEFVFEITNRADYGGEKLCRYGGVDYEITGTYWTDGDGIELTAKRSNADA